MSRPLSTVFVLACLLWPSAAFCEGESDWSIGGGFGFGSRRMSAGDWGEFRTQSQWALDTDLHYRYWPFALTVGYSSSKETLQVVAPAFTRNVESRVNEFWVGAKARWDPFSRLSFIGGAGPTFVKASLQSIQTPFREESSSAVGGWVSATALVRIGRQSVVGVQGRYSKSEVTLLGRKRDTGALQTSLIFGVGF